MTDEVRKQTERALAAYGYTLTPEGVIVDPGHREMGVCLKAHDRGRRVHARWGNRLLWSGAPGDVGEFLAGFWYARKLPTSLDALLSAALACENADDGEPLNNRYTRAAFAAPTRAFLLDRLNRFSELARPWLTAKETADPEQLAYDLWLTAQGHGAGFWDGDYQHGDRLADIATALHIGSLYVGDDDQLYIMGAEYYRVP